MEPTLTCRTMSLQDGVLTTIVEVTPETALMPIMELVLGNRVLGYADVQAMPGEQGVHMVKIDVPKEALNDGIQTLILRAEGAVEPVATMPMMAGDVLPYDLTAELDLLRTELDMLKKAFRRQLSLTRF